MTITSTQLESTSILDNHKPPGSYSCAMGEQDDTCSQYKPLQDRTKDYNLDSQANYEIPLFGTMPSPPPIPWMPPWSLSQWYIFRIFRTFSTLFIFTLYAFPAMFSTPFIMFILTHMANFLI